VPILANRFRKQALIASALVGTLVLATLPTAHQISVESCSPDGLFAKLSAAIHGNSFWRVQLADIARRRQSAEHWDQNQAEMRARVDNIARQAEEVVRQAEERLQSIREAHPSLTPTDAQLAAKRLRTLADKIEHDEADRTVSEFMRKQVPVLKQCEEAIIERLR
jgi:hypothetical protein